MTGRGRESTTLRFRYLLEEHKLALQILATVNELLQTKACCCARARWSMPRSLLRQAPPRTQTMRGTMHRSKKGDQWHFGMKAHIGVDADSGRVQTVRGTAGNVNDGV